MNNFNTHEHYKASTEAITSMKFAEEEPAQSAPIAGSHAKVLLDTYSGTARVGGAVTSDMAKPVSDPTDPTNPDFLDTGASKSGASVPRALLTENDLVTWRGFQMPVSGLVGAGILEKDPAGGYRSPSAKSEQRQTPTQTQPAPSAPKAFDSVTESVAAEIAHQTSFTNQTRALGELIRNGEVSAATMGDLAVEMRMQPDEFAAKYQSVQSGFQTQAFEALSESSLGDPAEIVKWAEANDPKGLAGAIRNHAMNRSTEGWQAIGKAYMMDYCSTPERRAEVLATQFTNGMKASLQGTTVVLNHPSWPGPVSWKEAIRQGLVSI